MKTNPSWKQIVNDRLKRLRDRLRRDKARAVRAALIRTKSVLKRLYGGQDEQNTS